MIEIQIAVMADGWTVSENRLNEIVAVAVATAELPDEHYELSLALSDDAQVRALNRDHRGKDQATNVLTYPTQQIAVGEAPPFETLGDIVFARQTCAREAVEQGKTFNDHFAHLLVHGLLHLYGHDHIEEGEADRMEAMEIRILARLGIADPYAHTESEPG